jgi:hypothetical protein
MEEYIKWLENKIEVCLEDKDLQREHWAFCQALKKYRELALRQPPVIESLPQDNFCKVCNLPTDGEKCYSKRCPV